MDLQQRLKRLVDDQDNYRCKDRASISDKRVVALLGPSAVGKSTLINACLERAQRWGMDSAAEAGTSATRPARPGGDPANYHTDIPMEDMVGMIEDGKPVNWSLFKTGHIYATLPQDFPAEYNFMACMPDSIPMLRRAGFAAVHAFYTVTEVDAWEEQLASRLYTPETITLPPEQRQYKPDAIGRVTEAIDSLEYSMKSSSNPLIRISNTPGEKRLPATADAILKTIMGRNEYSYDAGAMESEFNKNAREMFSRALDIKWEIEQAAEKS